MNFVETAANQARNILNKIEIEEKEKLEVKTKIPGDPVIYYECINGEYFKVTEERGNKASVPVAKSHDEMVDYFVEKAIRNFAMEIEASHRIYFENNLRQMHEIMEKCYSFIDGRKFVQDSYDDETHIILDLVNFYAMECNDIARDYADNKEVVELCNYLLNYEYADNPVGGMNDPKASIKKIHEKIEKLQEIEPDTRFSFARYEKHYNKIKFK